MLFLLARLLRSFFWQRAVQRLFAWLLQQHPPRHEPRKLFRMPAWDLQPVSPLLVHPRARTLLNQNPTDPPPSTHLQTRAPHHNSVEGQTFAACLPCPAGTASATPGASSADACVPCPGGSWAARGASFCEVAPAGAFAGAASSAISLCPLGTYNPDPGANASTACTACPPGATTASSGSTLSSQCLVLSFSCPAGSQPRTNSPPSLPSDCAPLLCPPPLSAAEGLPLALAKGCVGCRGGTSGSLAAGCLPCPIGKLCPGLTSRPLYNFSGSEGQWDAAVRGGRRTAVAVGLWAACPPLLLQPPLAPATASTLQQTMSLNFSSTNARTVVAGLAFICLVLLLLLAYCCWRRIRNPFETAAKFFDSYALRHQVPEGSAPEKRTTPMGGIFTLLALLTIACFTSYLVLEWQTNNLLVQRSLDVLTPDVWVSTAGLGWATAPVGGTQPPDSASLLIRNTVDGESGACALPLQSSATGLVAGNWSLIGSTANCAGTGASQLTYSCTGCQLGPSAALSLLFHYSCQSLFLEAASFPAYPRGTLSRQLLGAVAGSPGAPLTDIDWTLIPTLSVVWDNVTIENERGLMFTYSGSSSTGRALPLTATGLLVQPLAASLNLTILLPQSPTYIVTLLTLRVTLVQLLASILGLSSVLGAFGAAFGVTEGALAWVRTRGRAALKEKGRELRQALSKRLSSKLFSVAGKGEGEQGGGGGTHHCRVFSGQSLACGGRKRFCRYRPPRTPRTAA